MKIGLPKALEYYRNEIMWNTFFDELGVETVVSGDTNKNILDLGIKYSVDECCLSAKVYLGHVASLVGKCDKILVPRLDSLGNNEYICTKFNALYDIAANIFDADILDYNIDIKKGHGEEAAYMRLGKLAGKKNTETRAAYIKAKTQCERSEKIKRAGQQKSLDSDKLKILMIGHDYNVYDNIIGKPVVEAFKKLGAEVIRACDADKKICAELSRKLSPTLYWKYNKELIGALELYGENIDGVVFLTAFPCGPDSLVNELMIRKYAGKLPVINIIVDEQQSETGLITRAESFYDLLVTRKNKEGKSAI